MPGSARWSRRLSRTRVGRQRNVAAATTANTTMAEAIERPCVLVEEAGHRAELELLEPWTQERLEHAHDDDAQGSRNDRPPPARRRRTNARGGDATGSAEDHVQDRADRRVLPKGEEVEKAGRDANEDVANVDRRREEEEQTEHRPADGSRQPTRNEPPGDRAVREPAGRHVADDQRWEGEHHAPEREQVRDDVPFRERLDDADEAEIDEDDAGNQAEHGAVAELGGSRHLSGSPASRGCRTAGRSGPGRAR